MIEKIQIYSGSYSTRKKLDLDFNTSKLNVVLDNNKFVSNSDKQHYQFYYDNNKITKSTKVFGTCDVCGKKVEKIFDKRGWIRNINILFCSRPCSLKYNKVVDKTILKRFGNEGIKKHYAKDKKDLDFLQFTKSIDLNAISYIKQYPDFIYSERGINLIKELYINKNMTRKEVQNIIGIDINVANYIKQYDIRKYRITEEHKKKCSIALKKSRKSNIKYQHIENMTGCHWVKYFDKAGRMHKLQGTYELRFAKLLDKSNLEWNSYHKRIKIEDFIYAPDFIVEDKFVETKANYFYEQGKDKLSKISKYINLVLILTDDLLKIEENPQLLENYIYG